MMEALDNQFLSKDPTVISLMFSKLIEDIREKYKAGKEEAEQLSLLKSMCLSSDNTINEIASKGILNLLKEGILDSNKMMEDFITVIPNNDISNGVVKTICGMLYYQFSKSSKNSLNKFNIYFPQHPFITLIITNSKCFPLIYEEVRFAPKMNEIQSWNIWNYHFYQYCLCNPTNKEPTFFVMKLWRYLLSNHDELVFRLMTWMSFDPKGSLLISADLLNELSNVSDRSTIETEVVLLWQVSALFKLVSNAHDPRDTVLAVRFLVNKMDKVNFVNPILLILAIAITRASSPHALDILEICELLMDQPNVNHFVLQSVKVSLLHWIGNPSTLSKDTVSKADDIYVRLEEISKLGKYRNLNSYEIYNKYQDIIIPNQDLFIASELTIICESWKNRESILEFLTSLESQGYHFIKKVINFVFGIFICDPNDKEITLAAFKIICTYIENFKEFSHLVLTLILYNVSNTSNSRIHLELFKYLPKLAGVRENYQKVVTIMKLLYSSSNYILKNFGMRLMFDLWTIDHNTYPFLEEMLTEEDPNKHEWDFYITKTNIIKHICLINSNLYGEEMVAHLSRILNKCSALEGELTSAIALDAISVLCNKGVIDIKTTWLTLAPKYLMDKRTKTIKSMCGLAAFISSLLHPEHHKDLQQEVICKMWDYASDCPDLEVKIAALDALIEFGLENISPHFPERYLKEVPVPKSDLEPQFVPGGCWINFLRDQSNLEVVGDFLIKMVRKEVAEYPKYVYHITSKREPTDYSLLPSHSLVRGIVEYCSAQARRWNGLYKHVYIECMRILSQEYSKPLPPYNWPFLHQLFHEPELRTYCIMIASHQVMISGTARRFIENYIDALTGDFENIDEVFLIYKKLKFLANSIQPTIFEAFFEKTLNHAKYLRTEKKNEQFLISLIDALKDVLANPSVQDVSKKGIISCIDSTLTSLNESNEIFGIFVDCIICYPTDLLKNITALPESRNMTEELYRKAIHIRCKLALHTKEKLKWLDDLIDIGSVFTEQKYHIEEFLNIFKQPTNQTESIRWTVDLVGRIEATMANDCSKSKIVFLMEMLVVSLVAFSGCHIFAGSKFELEEYLKLLPQAANVLLDMKEWSNDSSKVIECFYFLNLNKEKIIPFVYQNAFGQTLQTLREHVEFRKGNKWMKYLNADIVLKNCQ